MEQKDSGMAPAKGKSAQETLASRGKEVMTSVRAMLGIDAFSFRGKVVLITGGSRGLGIVMARQLAAEGARLAILARDAEELARAKEDLRRRGAEVITLQSDVRDREQAEAAVQQVREQLGAVDVLINNAGVIQVGPMEAQTDDDYEDAMRTHFWGPLHLTCAVLPDMKERRSGRVVNISSLGGKVCVPHMLPYSASKFALTGLSEGMRAELMKLGVVVTTVCPGLMRTGSPDNAWFKGNNHAEHAWFTLLDSMPLLTVSAERAARLILRAVRRGRAEVTISLPAKLARVVQGLMPGLTADVMGLMDRLLPGAGGIGTGRATGRDSQSPLTRSVLTILTQKAAKANNETAEVTAAAM